MNRPCPKRIVACPDPANPGLLEEADWPITNRSSEAPDGISFTSPVWPRYNPDNGGIPPDNGDPSFHATDCWGVVQTGTSQEEANLLALIASQICPMPNHGTDERIHFTSDEQIVSGTCPDGSMFSYRVPAGLFVSPLLGQGAGQQWREAANQQAIAYGQQQVAKPQNQACISCPRLQGNQGWCCVNALLEPSLNSYQLTGPNAGLEYTFQIIAGAVPPGTSFSQTGINTAELFGMPSQAGTYSWTIRATRVGNDRIFTEVTDTMNVLGITTPSPLPDATQGTPYSQQLSAAGGTLPVTFELVGTLPPGLTMDASGLISGTPT